MRKGRFDLIPRAQLESPERAGRENGTAPDAGKGCTAKALIAGLIGAVCLGLGSTYNDMVIKGTFLAIWNLTPAAIFLFFVLVAVVNVILRLIHPRLALERGELAVAYFLILMANTLTGRAFSAMVLPVITGAYYYDTPENNWAEVVQPYLPAWPIPQEKEIIRGLYEGSSTGQVPWEAWLLPLFHWLSFGLALFLVMVCLMVIVRRQWVEHERLAYPMVQLPLAMIADGGRASLIGPLFRSGLMWLGLAIPVAAGTVNALHNYFGVLYSVKLGVNPSLLGFSYFIPRNVSLGLILFYWLNRGQRELMDSFGWQTREAAMGVYSSYTDPMIIHQAMGGMIVLVLGTLWVGRRHLRAVLHKALRGNPAVDDTDEIVSYRTAVLGAFAGFLAMGCWLWQMGIPLLVVPLLLFGAFVVFMTITRVVAQGGVAAMFPPTNAPDFVVSAVGASTLGPRGMAGLALSYAWSVDTLILLMSACANGLKLITEVGLPNRRRLFGGIVAVIVLTLGGSVGLNLLLGYKYGGVILLPEYFWHIGQYPYWFMEKGIHQPEGPNLNGWIHKGVGAAIMVLLMAAQHRFAWWPFHPLGFPVSCVFGIMWFSVFVAWIIKSLVLRIAGLGLFNRLKPFFLGLILGEGVVAGMWVVIDYFTGMRGNKLFGVVFQ